MGYWRKDKRVIEVTGRQGRKRRKLLDDLKERRGYSHLKEETLDRTMWTAGFGRGFGPVVRQTIKWMNYALPLAVQFHLPSSSSSNTCATVINSHTLWWLILSLRGRSWVNTGLSFDVSQKKQNKARTANQVFLKNRHGSSCDEDRTSTVVKVLCYKSDFSLT